MTCEGCASQIAKRVAKLKGVIKAEVSYTKGTATVSYDPAKTDVPTIRKAIEQLGYQAKLIP